MKKNDHCVQCGKEMDKAYGNQEWQAPFCDNLKCPNYGLLQAGMLPDDEEKKKTA